MVFPFSVTPLAAASIPLYHLASCYRTRASYQSDRNTANDDPDKMKQSGFTTVKSAHVNAPIIQELPVALECRLVKFNEDGVIVSEIVNVCAEESVLGADGKN